MKYILTFFFCTLLIMGGYFLFVYQNYLVNQESLIAHNQKKQEVNTDENKDVITKEKIVDIVQGDAKREVYGTTSSDSQTVSNPKVVEKNTNTDNLLHISNVKNPPSYPVTIERPQDIVCSTPFTRDLTIGATGDDVSLMQRILVRQGFLVENSYRSGFFEESTRVALYDQGWYYFAPAFDNRLEYGTVKGITKVLLNDLYCYGKLTLETRSELNDALTLESRIFSAISNAQFTLGADPNWKDLCSIMGDSIKEIESDFNVKVVCQSSSDEFFVFAPNLVKNTEYFCYDHRSYRGPNLVNTVPVKGAYSCPEYNYFKYSNGITGVGVDEYHW